MYNEYMSAAEKARLNAKKRRTLPGEFFRSFCPECYDPVLRMFHVKGRAETAVDKACTTQHGRNRLHSKFTKLNAKKVGDDKRRKSVLWTPEFNVSIDPNHLKYWNPLDISNRPPSICSVQFFLTTEPYEITWRYLSRQRIIRTACMVNGVPVRELRTWFDKLLAKEKEELFPTVLVKYEQVDGTNWYVVWIRTTHIYKHDPLMTGQWDWDDILDFTFEDSKTEFEISFHEYSQDSDYVDVCVDIDHEHLSYANHAHLYGAYAPMVRCENGAIIELKLPRSGGPDLWRNGHVSAALLNAKVPEKFWVIPTSRLIRGSEYDSLVANHQHSEF